MSRMFPRTLSAVLAFVIPTLAGAQASEPEYTDPEVYQVEAKYPVVSYPSGYVLNDNYPWEATSVAFDPRHEYTAEEQRAVLEEELRLSGGRLTTDATGAPVIEIIQPEIPEASQDTAPAAEEIYEENGQVPPPQLQQGKSISPTLTPATMSRRYYYSKGFGNNLFGSRYSTDTFVKATEATSTAAKKLSAYVESKVSGIVFKKTKDLMRARMDVAGQQGGTNGGTANLYALGQLVHSSNLAGTFSLAPVHITRDYGVFSKWFMVGPIPVKLKISLGGGVKLSLSGKISPTEARLNATPGAYATASTSAGVDLIIVAAGVTGSLTLINVGIPSIAQLVWPDCSGLTWKLAASVSLNTLSGTIKLFARLGFKFFGKTWYLTIANWPGITYTITLFSKTGSAAMGICPGFAPDAPDAPSSLMSMAAAQ
ncbi:hypothetical protein [Hyalangium versicolor]|uniref:hypothetical protein n=1 Tax=Hyalangium versicolor TaxID=2861190 RepID=UPI001CCEA3A1|nr:hypothetical protein [Hyalangium versicolor]